MAFLVSNRKDRNMRSFGVRQNSVPVLEIFMLRRFEYSEQYCGKRYDVSGRGSEVGSAGRGVTEGFIKGDSHGSGKVEGTNGAGLGNIEVRPLIAH